MDRPVFRTLSAAGVLARASGQRILEIGPKYGHDTCLLAGLGPSEIVIVDLPDKQSVINVWWDGIPEPKCRVVGNLMYMPRDVVSAMGRFSLVWCTGVLYHNAEQLRLVRRLFDLCADDGVVVVESEVLPDEPRAVVQVCWPAGYHGVPTITHAPSREAVQAWLEMSGFQQVHEWGCYPPDYARRRGVWTGIREPGARPARYYELGGMPGYDLGGAE